jgi:ribonucleoside-triphosphate reductase
MKIIKRDGRIVDYDRQKIAIAIEKANSEVRGREKASKEDIKNIVKYIEELDKKRMLVEDIQDIIEEQLMQLEKYELAKRYIVYRYNRALIRKQNTTDETILGIIRNENKDLAEENSNKNTMLASTQRDYIAGEVSRDLTKRLLLPEKISKANEEGVLHFHDADYFVQPIFNCCLINISDMLDNGTVMNGKLIESPKGFQVACTVATQIIAAVASNQYGGQSVDMKHFGKYLRKSYNKFKTEITNKYKGKITEDVIENLVQDRLKAELKAGIQTIQYQINTLMTTNGQSPFVTLFLHLEKDDPYIKENAMIIEEILKQRYETTHHPHRHSLLHNGCSTKRQYP